MKKSKKTTTDAVFTSLTRKPATVRKIAERLELSVPAVHRAIALLRRRRVVTALPHRTREGLRGRLSRVFAAVR